MVQATNTANDEWIWSDQSSCATFVGLAFGLGAGVSLSLTRYVKVIPLPTVLSLSSLIGHPYFSQPARAR
jgi:hypothetical protein